MMITAIIQGKMEKLPFPLLFRGSSLIPVYCLYITPSPFPDTKANTRMTIKTTKRRTALLNQRGRDKCNGSLSHVVNLSRALKVKYENCIRSVSVFS